MKSLLWWVVSHRILGVPTMGSHGQVLTFSDPDGNVAQLQVRAQQES